MTYYQLACGSNVMHNHQQFLDGIIFLLLIITYFILFYKNICFFISHQSVLVTSMDHARLVFHSLLHETARPKFITSVKLRPVQLIFARVSNCAAHNHCTCVNQPELTSSETVVSSRLVLSSAIEKSGVIVLAIASEG